MIGNSASRIFRRRQSARGNIAEIREALIGRPADTYGNPGTPGIVDRIARIEGAVFPNGGSSVADNALHTRQTVDEVKTMLTTHLEDASAHSSAA